MTDHDHTLCVLTEGAESFCLQTGKPGLCVGQKRGQTIAAPQVAQAHLRATPAAPVRDKAGEAKRAATVAQGNTVAQQAQLIQHTGGLKGKQAAGSTAVQQATKKVTKATQGQQRGYEHTIAAQQRQHDSAVKANDQATKSADATNAKRQAGYQARLAKAAAKPAPKAPKAKAAPKAPKGPVSVAQWLKYGIDGSDVVDFWLGEFASKPGKCMYCQAPATHGVRWAEGMARIPVDQKHIAKAKATVHREEGPGGIVGVDEVKGGQWVKHIGNYADVAVDETYVPVLDLDGATFALYGMDLVDPYDGDLYGMADPAHASCGIEAFCRNPLHPGPCKGWKHMLHSVSPGAYHAMESDRVKKLNEKRLAKIAALEAAGKKVPAYLKKEVTYKQIPHKPEGSNYTAPTPEQAQAALPPTKTQIEANLAGKHAAKSTAITANPNATTKQKVNQHLLLDKEGMAKLPPQTQAKILADLKKGETHPELSPEVQAAAGEKHDLLKSAVTPAEPEFPDHYGSEHKSAVGVLGTDAGTYEKLSTVKGVKAKAKFGKLTDEHKAAVTDYLKGVQGGDHIHHAAHATALLEGWDSKVKHTPAQKAAVTALMSSNSSAGKISKYGQMTPEEFQGLHPKIQAAILDDLDKKIDSSTPGATTAHGIKANLTETKPEAPKAPEAPAAPAGETPGDPWGKNKPPGYSQNDLKPTGGTLGTHGAQVHVDPTGQKWLVKPTAKGDSMIPEVESAISKLSNKLGVPTPYVHVIPGSGNLTHGGSSVQKFMTDAKPAFSGGFDPKKLSPADILTIQKHHALDWLTAQHDAHKGNWLRTPDGQLVEIDKGQAFKHLGTDKLDPSYHPNKIHGEDDPIYNHLIKAAKKGDVKLHDPNSGELGAFIKSIQDMPDDQIKNHFLSYAVAAKQEGKLPGGSIDGFMSKLVERKNGIGKAFADLHTNAGISHAPQMPDVPAQAATHGHVTPAKGKFEILADTGHSGDGHTTLPGGGKGPWGHYGAAGVMIKAPGSDGKPRYLLVQRGPTTTTNKGKWQLPGGALDSKENAHQGAARETHEELGASPAYLAKLQAHEAHVYEGPNGWKYTSIAATHERTFDPVVDGTETGAAKWFTAEELAKLDTDGKLIPALSGGALEKNVMSLYPDAAPSAPDIKITEMHEVTPPADLHPNVKAALDTLGEPGATHAQKIMAVNAISKAHYDALPAADQRKVAKALADAHGTYGPSTEHVATKLGIALPGSTPTAPAGENWAGKAATALKGNAQPMEVMKHLEKASSVQWDEIADADKQKLLDMLQDVIDSPGTGAKKDHAAALVARLNGLKDWEAPHPALVDLKHATNPKDTTKAVQGMTKDEFGKLAHPDQKLIHDKLQQVASSNSAYAHTAHQKLQELGAPTETPVLDAVKQHQAVQEMHLVQSHKYKYKAISKIAPEEYRKFPAQDKKDVADTLHAIAAGDSGWQGHAKNKLTELGIGAPPEKQAETMANLLKGAGVHAGTADNAQVKFLHEVTGTPSEHTMVQATAKMITTQMIAIHESQHGGIGTGPHYDALHEAVEADVLKAINDGKMPAPNSAYGIVKEGSKAAVAQKAAALAGDTPAAHVMSPQAAQASAKIAATGDHMEHLNAVSDIPKAVFQQLPKEHQDKAIASLHHIATAPGFTDYQKETAANIHHFYTGSNLEAVYDDTHTYGPGGVHPSAKIAMDLIDGHPSLKGTILTNLDQVPKADFDKLDLADQDKIADYLYDIKTGSGTPEAKTWAKGLFDKFKPIDSGAMPAAPQAPITHATSVSLSKPHIVEAVAYADGDGPKAPTAKNHLAAYEQLTPEEFHALSPMYQEIIKQHLIDAKEKFQAPAKKIAAQAALDKLTGPVSHTAPPVAHTGEPDILGQLIGEVGTDHIGKHADIAHKLAQHITSNVGLKNLDVVTKMFKDADAESAAMYDLNIEDVGTLIAAKMVGQSLKALGNLTPADIGGADQHKAISNHITDEVVAAIKAGDVSKAPVLNGLPEIVDNIDKSGKVIAEGNGWPETSDAITQWKASTFLALVQGEMAKHPQHPITTPAGAGGHTTAPNIAPAHDVAPAAAPTVHVTAPTVHAHTGAPTQAMQDAMDAYDSPAVHEMEKMQALDKLDAGQFLGLTPTQQGNVLTKLTKIKESSTKPDKVDKAAQLLDKFEPAKAAQLASVTKAQFLAMTDADQASHLADLEVLTKSPNGEVSALTKDLIGKFHLDKLSAYDGMTSQQFLAKSQNWQDQNLKAIEKLAGSPNAQAATYAQQLYGKFQDPNKAEYFGLKFNKGAAIAPQHGFWGKDNNGQYTVKAVVPTGYEADYQKYLEKLDNAVSGQAAHDVPTHHLAKMKQKSDGGTDKAFGNLSTKSVAAAIYSYSTDSRAINKMMRILKGKLPKPADYSSPSEKKVAKEILAIDAGMKKFSTTEDLVMMRGFDSQYSDYSAGSSGNVFQDSWSTSHSLVDAEWTDPAFGSTSTQHGTARNFSGGGNTSIVMRLFVPKGTPMVAMDHASHYSHESEILLGRNTKYRVVADHGYQNGKRMLDVEVVPG